MKLPRFRLVWVIVAVAIAAVDFWAIRALSDSAVAAGDFLVFGTLPMANIVAVALMLAKRRRRDHPFLTGFLVFGMMALALYVALTVFYFGEVQDHGATSRYAELMYGYIRLLEDPMETYVGRDRPFLFYPTFCLGLVVMLGGPQLAFALLGGFVSRKFKITITRR
jgi:hypothetical protein